MKIRIEYPSGLVREYEAHLIGDKEFDPDFSFLIETTDPIHGDEFFKFTHQPKEAK